MAVTAALVDTGWACMHLVGARLSVDDSGGLVAVNGAWKPFPSSSQLLMPVFIRRNVERELINHRSLLHPNIIRFKEVFVTATHLAIVMEYAAGGELFDRIVRTNPSLRWLPPTHPWLAAQSRPALDMLGAAAAHGDYGGCTLTWKRPASFACTETGCSACVARGVLLHVEGGAVDAPEEELQSFLRRCGRGASARTRRATSSSSSSPA
jgi:hypothetical protein